MRSSAARNQAHDARQTTIVDIGKNHPGAEGAFKLFSIFILYLILTEKYSKEFNDEF